MMAFIKKKLPFIVLFGVGIFTFIVYFIPHKSVKAVFDEYTTWAIIISGGAMLVGVVSLFRTHWKKMLTKSDPNRWYSAVALFCLIFMSLVGFIGGIKKGTLFDDIYRNMFVPLDATMFSLLAFYMASAAFRSFRMRNLEASLLLIAALIVMMGQIPLGEALWSKIPVISQYLLDYPNTAAQRAIRIGIGIGSVATGLKIVLGIEKNVFGGLGGGK